MILGKGKWYHDFAGALVNKRLGTINLEYLITFTVHQYFCARTYKD